MDNNSELYHYGVKGMKWGIRKNPKQYKNGRLTEKGFQKYYTNGKLNKRGQRAKKRAAQVKNFGQAGIVSRTIGYGTMTYGARQANSAAKIVSSMLHIKGNMTITKMGASGASYNSRKAVAGGYIAAMSAVRVASIYPYVSAVYKDTKYRQNTTYHNRTNALADLSVYEKTQRKKKAK